METIADNQKPHWTDSKAYQAWRHSRLKAGLPTRGAFKLSLEMREYYREKNKIYKARKAEKNKDTNNG